MTPKQARALLRSLRHRNRLAQKIPDLEVQLRAIVEAQGPCIVGGCRISIAGGHLSIDLIEIVPVDQLAFEFVEDQR